MGCFDFLTRKKKKEKKRKEAISARAERTKVSEKRSSGRGGVSFEVMLDNRPPTPFRGLTPRNGHKHITMEEKQESSLARREVMLDQRTNFARQSSIRRAEVLQRKENADVVEILQDVDGDVTPREEGHSVPSSSA